MRSRIACGGIAACARWSRRTARAGAGRSPCRRARARCGLRHRRHAGAAGPAVAGRADPRAGIRCRRGGARRRARPAGRWRRVRSTKCRSATARSAATSRSTCSAMAGSIPSAPLKEAHRCLEPGAIALFNLPAYDWLLSAHDRRVHNVRRFTRGQARALLAGHGFRVLRSSYWNTLLFPLMLLHRLIGRDDAESDVRDYPALARCAVLGGACRRTGRDRAGPRPAVRRLPDRSWRRAMAESSPPAGALHRRAGLQRRGHRRRTGRRRCARSTSRAASRSCWWSTAARTTASTSARSSPPSRARRSRC